MPRIHLKTFPENPEILKKWGKGKNAPNEQSNFNKRQQHETEQQKKSRRQAANFLLHLPVRHHHLFFLCSLLPFCVTKYHHHLTVTHKTLTNRQTHTDGWEKRKVFHPRNWFLGPFSFEDQLGKVKQTKKNTSQTHFFHKHAINKNYLPSIISFRSRSLCS